MKANYKVARYEVKKLIDTIGLGNILNLHINEMCERTTTTNHDVHNALNYFMYRKPIGGANQC
jgi:hypothetical protein